MLAFFLPLIATLGCGLVAGVFFAFSAFVMRALARRPAHEALTAMQAINVTVLNPWFLGVFLGTGMVCAAALAHAVTLWPSRSAALLTAGSLLYLLGTVLVTMTCNVPRNERLARLSAADPAAQSAWREYVDGWTRWNHVRTVASLAAAAAFAVALTA
jgi:uncharacterized membrane protein